MIVSPVHQSWLWFTLEIIKSFWTTLTIFVYIEQIFSPYTTLGYYSANIFVLGMRTCISRRGNFFFKFWLGCEFIGKTWFFNNSFAWKRDSQRKDSWSILLLSLMAISLWNIFVLVCNNSEKKWSVHFYKRQESLFEYDWNNHQESVPRNKRIS